MTNDYYDFNPSATTWALLLTGIVVFVVALCVLLIYFIARSEADSVGRPHLNRRDATSPEKAPDMAPAKAAQPARAPRWSAAAHRHA